MHRYDIDYEYGFAVLLSKTKLQNPISTFYNLADQCFGIRKSVGATTLTNISTQDDAHVSIQKTPIERHPEIYDNALTRLVNSLSETEYSIPPQLKSKAQYILIHSGGDMIIWNKQGKKIKSEWD